MNNPSYKKITDHPDCEEILNKLCTDIDPSDITDWLKVKYSAVGEVKYVISEKTLKSFKDNYLDFYQIMKKDISKNSKAIAAGNIDDLQVVLSNNASYKSKLLATVDNEIDVKKMLATMIIAVETRVEQMFDQIQERPEEVNSRTERLWLEYFDRLGTMLEKWSKYVVGAPDQVIQHNFTVQHIDQHVQILQEAIRDALTEFDLETSLKFMDRLNISLQKLKDPGMSGAKPTPQGVKISEVKILSEEINRKLNED